MDLHTVPRRGILVHSLLDEAVADAPLSRAVRDSGGVWTYRELADYSYAVDAWLAARGVEPGDRVVVQMPTSRELVALLFGISRRGAIFVPLNPSMKQFHVRAVLANAEPRLMLTADDAAGTIDEAAGYDVSADSAWCEIEDLRALGERAGAVDVTPDSLAILVYTSGSTAAPKGVMGPHSQVCFASEAIQAELGYRPDDVVFCRFPMSWDYGLYKVLLSCLGRSEIVLADGDGDLVLIRRMREVGATVLPIVPSLATMIATLAERESEPAPPLRMVTNTGAALQQSTIDKLRALFPGVRVVRQFGQTECKRITIMPPDQDQQRPNSVGRPLPGTSVLIVDAEDRELRTGEIGEIVATGPHVMPGYWRAPQLTEHTFRAGSERGELRLHTGDYGWLDEDGYLYYEGRRDDMFKRKGIRMSTLEIEAAAMDIPGVRAAGAVPPTESRDLALVVETDLSQHTVLRELATRLEPLKVPSKCHVVAEFPLTAHGKNATKELALLAEEMSR